MKKFPKLYKLQAQRTNETFGIFAADVTDVSVVHNLREPPQVQHRAQQSRRDDDGDKPPLASHWTEPDPEVVSGKR